MTLTIRQHLEWIAKWSVQHKVNEHAVAALKALDEATGCNPVGRTMTLGPVTHRLVPDPAPPTENT